MAKRIDRSSERYHEGERAAQRSAGEEYEAGRNAAVIADAVTPSAGPFLRAQRMLVIASRDTRERPRASVIFGDVGFVSADDGGRRVTIDRTAAYASDTDVIWADIAADAPLGLLAIELSTRRRLRVNGYVEQLTDERLVLHVVQAYPNCPKYIQRRRLRAATPRERTGLTPAREGRPPDAAILNAVRAADTIFVASGHPSRGLDASHRGGPPGFVAVLAPDVFRITVAARLWICRVLFADLGANCRRPVMPRRGAVYVLPATSTVGTRARRSGRTGCWRRRRATCDGGGG